MREKPWFTTSRRDRPTPPKREPLDAIDKAAQREASAIAKLRQIAIPPPHGQRPTARRP